MITRRRYEQFYNYKCWRCENHINMSTQKYVAIGHCNVNIHKPNAVIEEFVNIIFHEKCFEEIAGKSYMIDYQSFLA